MEPESKNPREIYRSPAYGSSLELQPVVQSAEVSEPVVAPQYNGSRLSILKFDRSALYITGIIILLVLLLGLVGVGIAALTGRSGGQNSNSGGSGTDKYAISSVQVNDQKTYDELKAGEINKLAINGELKVNRAFILTPTSVPQSPATGQIYFDKTTNQPYYYNGKQFVALGPTSLPAFVNSLGGASGSIGLGSGLAINGNQLSLSASVLQAVAGAGSINGPRVTSFQGLTGDVTLAAGTGISISGTTITNTGVTGLTGTANQVNVSASTGGVTLSLPQDIATTSTPTFGGATLNGALNVTAGGATIQGATGLTLGTAGSANGSLLLANTSNSNYTVLRGLAPAGSNQVITIPDSGGASDTVCLLNLGNCTGGGSGVTSSGGTQNYLPKFTNAGGTQIGNSLLYDNGVSIGVGTNAPNASYVLDVNGSVRTNGDLTQTGTGSFSTGTGNVSLNGDTTITGTGNFTSGTGAVTLNGNTSVAGTSTFSVGSGATTLGGSLGVSGLSTLSGGLTVSGTITLSSLNSAGVVHTDGSGVLSTSLIVDADLQPGTFSNITGTGALTSGSIGAGFGNINIGTNTFTGNGSGLTNVDAATLNGQAGSYYTNASNISSGTLNDARLSANVTLQGNTFNGANQLVQLNGSGGLPAIDGSLLTNVNAATLNGQAGSYYTNASNISSGTLNDARLSANVTLQGNTFNGVSQLVQLDGFGNLPALNGAALTSLNASNISTGTLNDARLSANVTLQGNTFNGANQLVQLNGTGLLPALNGSLLTNVDAATLNGQAGSYYTNASNISSGTLSDARLSANVTVQGNTFNGVNQLVQLDGSGFLPALNGSLLTNLNASAISSGTVANTYLTNGGALTVTAGTGLTGGGSVALGGTTTLNVAYGSAANTAVQGNTTLTCPSGTGNLSGGGGSITLGTGGSCGNITITNSPTFSGTLTVQGPGGVVIGVPGSVDGNLYLANSSSSRQVILQALNPTGTGDGTIQLPSIAGGTTDTVCLYTLANCTGVGGGITGSGTSGKLAKFTGTGSIGDSSISESGSTVTASGNVVIQGAGSLTLGTASTNTGSIAFYNSTNANTVTLQAGASGSNFTLTLPTAVGSNGDCLLTTGGGTLVFGACTGGAGGGVTSLDSQTGVLTLANSSGAAGTITIDDASTSAKGIAQFNATNFTASSGTINTIQDIDTSASPTFGGITIAGTTILSALSSAGIVHTDGSGVLSTSAVVLGTDTSGDYVANLGSLTGLSTTGNSGAGSTPTLSVLYGSSANTAVQGNTTLTCASGTGNLSGGGGSVTLGSGGSCGNITITNSPTFSGTLAVQGSGGITVGVAGSVDGVLNLANGTNSNLSAIQALAPSGTGTATYQLPSIAGGSTATFCLSTNNCSATGTAGGDLTGSYPNPTIASLQGTTLTISSIASGEVLQYDGSAIVNGKITDSNLQGGNYGSITGTGALTSGSIGSGFGNINIGTNTFTGNGSGLTNVDAATLNGQAGSYYTNASNISSGTLNDARLSANVTLQGNTFNGANQLVQLDGSGFLPALNGSLLTDLNGSAINSGTVDNAYLTNSGALTVTAGTGLTGGGSVALGGTTTLNVAYGSAANTAVQGNTTLTCASGTGNLSGGGGTITLGTGGSCGNITITNSPTFSGTLAVQGSGGITVGNTGSVTGSVSFLGSTGASGTLTLIGPANPSTNTLTLPNETGTICSTGSVCSGYAASSGGTGYIQNQNSGQQSSSNFWISGTGRADTSLQAPLLDTATAVALDIGTSNATNINLNQNTTLLAGKTLTVDGEAFSDLTGSGLLLSGGALTVDDSSATGFFRNGGNTFGAAATLGTNDSNVLNVETNNTTRFQIAAASSTLTGQGATTLTSTGTLSLTSATGSNLGISSGTGGTTNINSGGQVTLTSANGYSVDIASGTNGALNLDSGTIGTVNLGTGSNSKTVTIGNLTGSTKVNLQAGTGGVTINGANSSSALLVQSSIGDQVINVDTSGTVNLLSNGQFETGITGWVAKGTGTPSQSTSEHYTGKASLKINTSGYPNGAKYSYALVSSTTYTLSFWAKQDTNVSSYIIDFGYSNDGTSDTSCSGTQYTNSTGIWQEYRCTFTTGTTSGTPYIYIIGVGPMNYYFDNIMLEAGTTTDNAFYQPSYGDIEFNGIIKSPLLVQSSKDGDIPLEVADAAGNIILTLGTDSTYGNSLGLSGGLSVTGGVGGNDIGGSTTFSAGGVSFLDTVTSTTNSSTAFQIQNINNVDLLSADTSVTPNLIINPSFETNTSAWAPRTAATLAKTTAQHYVGSASLSVTTAATAGRGVKSNYTSLLASSTTYSLSFYAKLSSGTFTTMQVGRSDDGTTGGETNCLSGQTVSTTQWTRYTCTFTTGTTNSSTYIYINQSDATARTFFIDGVQLEQAATATNFNPGTLAFDGVINSHLTVQNSVDSNTAVQIQNASGTTILGVDTVNSKLYSGIADGASAVGFALNTSNAYTTSGAKLLSVQNAGIEKFSIDKDGNVNIASGAAYKLNGVDINTAGTLTNVAYQNQANTFTSAQTIQASNSLTLGLTGTNTGSILFKGSTAASGTLTLIGPSNPSNNTLTLPNETGTICSTGSVCSGYAPSTGGTGYIQNQNASQQSSSNFWISGTGRADTALQAPLVDTATGVALAIGTTNATAINLNQNTTIAAGKTLTVTSGAVSITGASTGDALTVSNDSSTGNIAVFKDSATSVFTLADGGGALFKNSANSTSAFQIQNFNSTSPLFNADTTNMRISVGSIGTATSQLYVSGYVPSSSAGSVTIGAAAISGLVAKGNYVYAIDSSTNALDIVDTSKSPTLTNAGSVSGPSSSLYGLAISGRYAYSTDPYEGRIIIFDVSNPSSPSVVGNKVIATDIDSTFESASESIVVQGHYAYVVSVTDGTVIAVDVTNPANPTVVGTTSYGGAGGVAMKAQGRYLYVIDATNNTLDIFDISNPASITATGSSYGLSGTFPLSLDVSGDYAFITNVGTSDALRIYNISDPTSPSLVGTASTGTNPLTVTVQSRYAYVGMLSGGMKVVDISNVSSPTVASGTSSGSFTDMAVQGRYAYGASGSTSVSAYDLGGAYVQQLETGGVLATNLSTSGDASIGGSLSIQGGLSVADSSLFGSIGVAGKAWFQNTSNSTDAFQVQKSDGTTLFGVDTTNSKIFTGIADGASAVGFTLNTSNAYTTAGAKLLSVQNSGTEKFSIDKDGNVNIASGASYYIDGNDINVAGTLSNVAYLDGTGPQTFTGDNLFQSVTDSTTAFQIQNSGGTNLFSVDAQNSAVSSTDSTFAVQSTVYGSLLTADTSSMTVNIGSIGQPTGQLYVAGSVASGPTGSVGTGSGSSAVSVQSNYAYVANRSANTMSVVDVSDPSNPYVTGSVATNSTPSDVYVQGRYAYVVTSNTLQVFDISNPTSPSAVSSISVGSSNTSVYVQGRYAYIATNSTTLQIVDISNPLKPIIAGSITLGGTVVDVHVIGRYAYVLSSSSVQIVDVSNPASPSSVGSVALGFTASVIYVQGRYAYVVGYNGSNFLGVVDISDPTSPSLSGSTTVSGTLGNTFGVYVQGRYAYVTNWWGQDLETFDVSSPASPVSLGTIASGSNLWGIQVQGRYAYAASYGGIQIFDLGGAYAQQLEAGGISSGTLSTTNNASIGGNLSVQGGLSVLDSTQLGGLAVSGQAVFQGSNTSTTAFQIQNSNGVNLLNVDTTTPNLIANPSFESGTTGWAQRGTATLAQTTAQKYFGLNSMSVATGAAANNGVKYNYALSSSTTYSLSFYAKLSSGTFTTMQAGRADNGSTDTNCLTGQTVLTTQWTRYTCTFTTGTTSGTPYIYIKQSDATARTFYIDGVQLEQAAAATNYNPGAIMLDGIINSHPIFQNSVDANQAFQIQNSSGTALFTADTINNSIGIGTAPLSGWRASIQSTGNTGTLLLSGNASASSYEVARVVAGHAGQTVLTAQGVASQTADLFQAQNSSGTKLSGIAFDGSLTANAQATATTATTSGTGSNTTTVTLTGSAFANGDVIFIDNAGQDYYTRITAGGGTASLTVSPAVSFDNAVTVTKYTVQNIGSTTSDYTTQSNRFFQGNFLGDVTVGAGSTTLSDGRLTSTTNMNFNSPSYNFQNTSNSTTAFQIQNSTGTALFNTDTSTGAITISGQTSGSATALTVTNNTSTGNILVAKDNSTAVVTVADGGGATFQNSVNGTTALQVENSTGEQLLNVDTTNSVNLIANGSLEVNTTGWSAKGAATISRDTGQHYSGNASLKTVTTTASNDGAYYPYSLSSNTTYTITFYAKLDASSAAFTNMTFGRSDNGSTDSACLSSQTVVSSGWKQFVCTFTTGTVSGSPYIYIKQLGGSTAHTFYVDGVQLEAGIIGTNVVTNSGFETDTSGWTAYATGGISRTTSQANSGSASLQVDSSGSDIGSEGALYYTSSSLLPNTKYTFRLYAKLDASSPATSFALHYLTDYNDSERNCSGSNPSVTSSGWTLMQCTFTTGASLASYGYVAFLQTTNLDQFITSYIDDVSISATNYSPFTLGQLSINGIVTSPLVLQNASDSTTAFQILNSNKSTLLNVDSVNSALSFNGSLTVSTNVSLSGTLTASTKVLTPLIDSPVSSSPLNIGTTNATGIYLNQNTVVANNKSFSAGGSATFKDATNSPTAFSIQNQSSVTLLNADTTNMRISVGTLGAATGQLYVSGQLPSSSAGSLAYSGAQYVYVQGRYAYVTASNDMKIIDISNSASPTVVSTVSTGANPNSVYVQGRYAYVVNYGSNTLQIFDVSNAASPTSVSTVSTGTAPRSVYVQGRYAYVVNYGSNTLQIFDVADVSNPTVAGTVSTGTAPRSVYVQGRYAYVANYTAQTLEVFDINDVTNPTSVGSAATGSVAYSVYVQGRYAYVSTASSQNLRIYDISNPSSPTQTSAINVTGSGPPNIHVQGRYAYLADTTHIYIVDVSNPASPSNVGNIGSGGSYTSVYVQGRYVYGADTSNLQIFDMGGTYSQQLEAGTIDTGSISINNNGYIGGNLTIQGGLSVSDSSQLGSIGVSGTAVFQNANNSTSAFRIQDTSANTLFSVDTLNGTLAVRPTAAAPSAFVVQANVGYNILSVNTDFDYVSIDNGWLDVNGVAAPTNLSVSLTGTGGTLTNARYYWYKVIAKNASGVTSNAVSPTTPSVGYVLTANGTSQANLSWTATTDAYGYYVLRAVTTTPIVEDTDWTDMHDITSNPGGTVTFTDTGSGALWTSGSYGGYVRQNYSSAVDLAIGGKIEFDKANDDTTTIYKNASNNVLTVTNWNNDIRLYGGSVTAQNTSDNTNAFQIQNTNGDSLFNVDTINNVITLGGNNSPTLSNWATNTSNPLPAGMAYHSSATANGYVYIIGGIDGTARTQVYYAKLNVDGSIGTWTSTTAIPSGRGEQSTVVANGYIYSIGGYNGTSALNNVYYNKLNADGSLAWASWASTTNLPYGLDSHSSVTANGYVYIIGGYDGTNNHGDVYYAKLNADGTVGSWTSTNALPSSEKRTWTSSVTANGYVYVMGGKDNAGTYRDTVYYAKLNTNGTVGSWSTANNLPAARAIGSAVTANGYVYYLGGQDSGANAKSDVYYAKLNSDGTTGTWTTTNSFTAARYGQTSVSSNGYVYILGGYNAAYKSEVYYASTQRIQVGGSLDLVGLGGSNLADGQTGTGGELTAGNTNIVGLLQVAGNANFIQSVAVGGELNVGGSLNLAGGSLTSGVADGASAVGFTLNTTNTFSTAGAKILSVKNNGTEVFSIDKAGHIVTFGHIKSTQTTAPTSGTPATCGTTPTSSVTAGSTDSAGSFTITTGTGALGAGTCATTISFNRAYGSAPKSILVTPKSQVSTNKTIYVSATATGTFTVTFGTAATVNSQANDFYYWVIE